MPIDKNTVCIIGVPIDLGAGRRGVDMGPSAIRVADLDSRLEHLGFLVEDRGDVSVKIPETEPVGQDNLRFKGPILSMGAEVMATVHEVLDRSAFPLVIGGDHSLSIGSIAGVSRYFSTLKERIGLIWLDAHGDFNTPDTTPSGNIHGMACAIAAGLGDPDLIGLGEITPKVSPENIVIVGARDLDAAERDVIRRSGVTVFTMRDIDERGMRYVIEDAVDIASDGTAGVHVSFDLDVIDPEFAPGTGTPVRGGVYYREGHLAMEIISDRAHVVSMDMVEVNPVLDTLNQTANLGVEMALSLLGKRIL